MIDKILKDIMEEIRPDIEKGIRAVHTKSAEETLGRMLILSANIKNGDMGSIFELIGIVKATDTLEIQDDDGEET